MRTQALDTTPEAELILIRLLRAATPARKMAMVLDANRTVRILALAGLQAQFRDESKQQIRRRLADLLLGAELAAKAYGPQHPNE